ncbi:MAG: hypothetical protein HDR37_07545 [Treponema sp.]|nr:hypothetical protein [Treponema sp.]
MTTNVDDKDTAWALKTFRPLLKALKLQEAKSEPLTVFPSQYKIFHRHNMTNCVIVVKTKAFTNKDDRGIFIWQYNKESDFYALYIVLNSLLFADSNLETRIKRKTTGVHEFTHCVAAMMTFSRLQSKALIRTMHERMARQFHSLDKNSLELLLRELTKPLNADLKESVPVFPDDHFRTGGEDFTGKYDELAKNFLLSYELFCEQEFFGSEKQRQFKDFLKRNQKEDALRLLVSVIKPLSDKKALSVHFIIKRIDEEFLQRLTR